MGVTTNLINKPFNPRAQDASPLAYNRAALYSGKALDFDGVNDYVEVSNITDTYKSFVLSFNSDDEITSTTPVQRMFGVYSSYFGVSVGSATGVLTGETLTFLPDGSSRTATTMNFAANTWYHLAVVWNSLNNNFDIYINGQNKTILSLGTTSLSVVNSLKIGQTIATGTPWKGKISGFKGFTESLTAAQVADLYNFPEKIVPTGVANTALKLWLPMMESAGTTAYDGSGNGNHGTISGATYVNGVGAAVAQSAVIDWNKGVNILDNSENFSGWTTETGTTITSDSIAAPDGLTTADTITSSASTIINQRQVISSMTSGADYVFSVWLKKKSTDNIQIYAFDTDAASFVSLAQINLNNGDVTDINGTGATAESYANGWYRFSIYFNASSTTLSHGIYTDTAGAADVYAWGGQSEQSDTLGPYVRTGSTAQPTPVLLPAGLTTGRDITGVNLFENVRKQGALNLDGQSWAEVHDNASVDVQSFTLECWVNLEFTGTYQEFMSKGDSGSDRTFELYLNNTENRFGVLVNTITSSFATQTINENQWYHVVASYDSSNDAVKGYVDSAEKLSTTLSVNPNNTDSDVVIGAWIDKSGLKTNGQIAQPRIYNRALTNEEIQRNYNAGKNIYS